MNLGAEGTPELKINLKVGIFLFFLEYWASLQFKTAILGMQKFGIRAVKLDASQVVGSFKI